MMKLNKKIIVTLISQQSWAQNELTRRMNIRRGSLNNALNGRRGVGRKIIAGLLRTFPDESIESFIIHERKVNQNACNL